MSIQIIAMAFLAATAIGGVAWVFLYPILSGQRAAEQRRAAVAASEPTAARRVDRNQRSRREQVEESLRELDARHRKAQKVSITIRIAQAGLSWSKQQFIMISIGLGIVVLGALFFVGAPLLPMVLLAGAAGFGAPRWLLNYLKKRREAKFLNGLPDAVDVIVRGVKSGLPLLESLKIVAVDAQEPIRTEFANILETQAIGMPIGDACARLYERMPVPEANFFAIVIAIQSKSGGNLSEALGNLSKVLRDRKKMKDKIKAMSMEAKASAAIIGALPLVVMGAVSVTSPGYISILFTHPTGHLMLAAGAASYTIGTLVMRKMINFDF
jgi:tight adherence protein B